MGFTIYPERRMLGNRTWENCDFPEGAEASPNQEQVPDAM